MNHVQPCTIYLVRHGQTTWNVQGLLQGHRDSPLTDTGLQQATEIAQILKDLPVSAIFSSDLLRAKKTADIIALEHNLAVTATKFLRERNYGIYEGKPFEEYNTALQQLFIQYQQLSTSQKYELSLHESVETPKETLYRFTTFLREVAIGYSGKTVIIVTHGGIIRYFLIQLGYGTHDTLPPGSISNTALIKITSDGVEFSVSETKGVQL